MRQILNSGAVLLVAGLVAISSPVLADHPHHSPAKVVNKALSGATVAGDQTDGSGYRISYAPDGTSSITVSGKTYSGTWTVDAGGHYCETWTGLFDGKKRCGGIEVVSGLLIMRGDFKTTRTVVDVKPAAN